MTNKRHSVFCIALFMFMIILAASLLPVNAWEVQAGEKSHKVCYRLNGGKNNLKNVKYLRADRKLLLRNPTRTGYTFRGWYEKGRKVTKIRGNRNHTLTAKWKKDKSIRMNKAAAFPSFERRGPLEIDGIDGPLFVPKNEKPNEDGSRNIYPM